MFPAGFSIAERPHLPKAMGSAPFDDEGVATVDRELIADGVLTGYILSSYSARKLGLKTTGNAGGAHNLLVAPTQQGGLSALIARLGTGLLVEVCAQHGAERGVRVGSVLLSEMTVAGE